MNAGTVKLVQNPGTDVRAGFIETNNGIILGTIDLYQNGKPFVTLVTSDPDVDVFGSIEEAIASMALVLHEIMQIEIPVGGT